jgi:hypothetical protein
MNPGTNGEPGVLCRSMDNMFGLHAAIRAWSMRCATASRIRVPVGMAGRVILSRSSHLGVLGFEGVPSPSHANGSRLLRF